MIGQRALIQACTLSIGMSVHVSGEHVSSELLQVYLRTVHLSVVYRSIVCLSRDTTGLRRSYVNAAGKSYAEATDVTFLARSAEAS